MSTTVDAIKRILAKVKADPTLDTRLTDTADLVDEVGLDSLEMLQLMLEIEATLAVQIDFDKLEYDYLRSIQSLATFLDSMPAIHTSRAG
jgi:acyl carrier protein